MVRTALVGGTVALAWALSAGAHEVSASTVKVVAEGARLEVRQTTPYKTARRIASLLGERREHADGKAEAIPEVQSDEAALRGMALGWSVTSEAGGCRLERHAHRRTHRDTQLEMRYLFVCPDDARPERIALPWLMQAPEDHFVIFELTRRHHEETSTTTRIFERQSLTVGIPP